MINMYPFWSGSRLPDEHAAQSELGWFHEDVWNKVWFHQSQISEENYKTIGGHGTNAKSHFLFLRGDAASQRTAWSSTLEES